LTRSRSATGILFLVAAVLLPACAGRRVATEPSAVPLPEIGVYRGRIEGRDGDTRKFKLMLYVAPPDHLHAEVVSPLGSTVMIIDGGDGRLAVTLVKEGVSYVGQAQEEILERILGLRLSLEELVQGILTGDAGRAGHTVIRGEGPEDGLPGSITFRSDDASLTLELKKLRPLRGPPETLGTGEPPAGTEIRGLDDLGAEHRLGAEGGES